MAIMVESDAASALECLRNLQAKVAALEAERAAQLSAQAAEAQFSITDPSVQLSDLPTHSAIEQGHADFYQKILPLLKGWALSGATEGGADTIDAISVLMRPLAST